jgi:hypothetical protein
LDDSLVYLWNAFWDLCGSRSVGMGLGAICYESITAYLDEEEIYGAEARDWYRRMINAMDRVYLSHKAESHGDGGDGTRS